MKRLTPAFDSIPASLFYDNPAPEQLTVEYFAQHLANDNYSFCTNFGDKMATVAPVVRTTTDSEKEMWRYGHRFVGDSRAAHTSFTPTQ